MNVEVLTESPTADFPSADPLDLLPLRQLLVYVARANRRSLIELAELLGVNRDTVRLDLKMAMRTLSEHGAPAPERPTSASGREYRCRDHAGGCPARCSYLLRWLAEFDRAMPAVALR